MVEHWLSGWKAIGEYIQKSEQTAKLWYYRWGMPVHSGPGGPCAIPFELDQWLMKFSEKLKGSRTKIVRPLNRYEKRKLLDGAKK